MASMTRVLEWKDTSSLGGTSRGDEEWMSPSMPVTSWSAWSSAWAWMRSQPKALRVRIKETAGTGDVIVEVCYRPPDQEDRVDEALYRQIGAASCSQALVFAEGLQPSRYLLAGQRSRALQSRRFLECVGDKFLLQVIEEPMRRGAMLDLVLTNKEGLVGNGKLEGSLGCSDHEIVEFKILRVSKEGT